MKPEDINISAVVFNIGILKAQLMRKESHDELTETVDKLIALVYDREKEISKSTRKAESI